MKPLDILEGRIPDLKRVYGFDTETCNKNKGFVIGSIVNDVDANVFYDRDSMIQWFLDQKKKTYIIATNLGFDSLVVFGRGFDLLPFTPFFRDSDMITGKCGKCVFLDTMNYAKMSVKRLGELVSTPKLESPSFLGFKPRNKDEWDYIRRYNVNDSFISYKAFRFFQNNISTLGGRIRYTIASSSMDLYRRRFLKKSYYRPNKAFIEELRRGYYGGRTEAFQRGRIKNYNYYDFNSLYPSVMVNEYPDPNSRKHFINGSKTAIFEYEGLSDVKLTAPDLYYPLIPYKHDKLLFPTGMIRGYYTHLELREAVKCGYSIDRVFNQFVYYRTTHPFRDYVKTLYDLRLKYKAEKNPLEFTIKIMLNSLYGKFIQRIKSMEVKHIDKCTPEELTGSTLNYNYATIEKEMTEAEIPKFIIPIWSIYVTAYARIKLWKILQDSKAIYCDTDSIITKKEYDNDTKLGGLKLEKRIRTGMIVKPKMYLCNEEVKLKGFSRSTTQDFSDIIAGREVSYTKFLKFKETLTRKKDNPYFNKPIEMIKKFSLEDNKRWWQYPFDPDTLQDSKPIYVTL